jgi:hypothetical protein
MAHLRDIVLRFTVGAALLLGIGLALMPRPEPKAVVSSLMVPAAIARQKARERRLGMEYYHSAMSLNPMSTFDPDQPCRVHERLNDKTFDWHTGWASKYRQTAVLESDGVAYFDGLMLDGWTSARRPRLCSL